MKVLFVAPFIPWPLDTGGKIRSYHLVRAVKEHVELELRFVREPGQGEEHEAALRALGLPLRCFDRGRPGVLTRLARPKLERWFHSPALFAQLASDARGGFDVVHLDELLLARAWPRHTATTVCQHHHKLDTVLYEELWGGTLAARFDLWKLRALERQAARRTPHHITCSREDAAQLAARYPGLRTAAVPSGYDPAYYAVPEQPPPRTRDTLLYLGSMGYGPNVDAVRWFCSEILPRIRAERPAAELRIVGRDAGDEVRALAGDGVRIVGEVDDVRPHLASCAAMVVPLRIGGGTRLKIVEALALATPLASTTIGAEGLGLTDGEALRLADDAESFARATLELLARPAQARALGERGRAQVAERFPWPVLGASLAAAWSAARDAR